MTCVSFWTAVYTISTATRFRKRTTRISRSWFRTAGTIIWAADTIFTDDIACLIVTNMKYTFFHCKTTVKAVFAFWTQQNTDFVGFVHSLVTIRRVACITIRTTVYIVTTADGIRQWTAIVSPMYIHAARVCTRTLATVRTYCIGSGIFFELLT